MKRILSYLVFAILAVPLPSSGTAYLQTFRDGTSILPNSEIRAAWVVRYSLNSKEEVDRVIDYAERARFQLLFVQVRGRGDAFYRSQFEPPAQSLRVPVEQFDPLAYLLARADSTGIAVHAWVNVCYVWSDPASQPPPNHIVRRHPEWLVADRDGMRMDEVTVDVWQDRGLEGYYVSPAHSAMRRHTASVIKDIVAHYPVDGVHLDYIRYPGVDFDFSETARTGFALRYGIDPLALVDREPTVTHLLGDNGTSLFDSLYVEWRSAQIDSLIHLVRESIGDLPLSAAVIPEFYRAKLEKGQDWLRWVQNGDVDFVVPMAYAYKPAGLEQQMRTIKRTIGADRFLVGLPVYDGSDQYLGYSVSLLRREGIMGYALFSYNALAQERFSLQFLERVFLETPE